MSKLIVPEGIEEYSRQFTSTEYPVLAALDRETNLRTARGIMLSGHLQGAFLQMFSMAVNPMNILEVGTFTGYSAICLARGLRTGGKIHTIEHDEELYDLTFKYFEEAGIADKVVHRIGRAADVIPTINETFELVFLDADKGNYELYFDQVIDKVVPGGFILADNVLYEGEVIMPIEDQCANAKAMHKFNLKIQADDRVEHMLLPLRDGIMIMRKK